MRVLLLLLSVTHLKEVASLYFAAVTISLRDLLEGGLAFQVGAHLLLGAVLRGNTLPRLLIAAHLLAADDAHEEVQQRTRQLLEHHAKFVDSFLGDTKTLTVELGFRTATELRVSHDERLALMLLQLQDIILGQTIDELVVTLRVALGKGLATGLLQILEEHRVLPYLATIRAVCCVRELVRVTLVHPRLELVDDNVHEAAHIPKGQDGPLGAERRQQLDHLFEEDAVLVAVAFESK